LTKRWRRTVHEPACRAASHGWGWTPAARRRAGRVIDGFVLGSAECHGQCIAFWQFSKYSLVVTMITVAISTGYLWLHYIALA
jgi:hypothetical protein